MLFPVVVGLPDEVFKYVEGILVSKCLSLDMKTEVAGFGGKFKSFLNFAYD